MTIQKKITVKHRRLYYNITLLSKLVYFIKHNDYYIPETSIYPVYENSYWTMLHFNVLIDDYFQLGEDEFFNQKLEDYIDLNKKLDESISLSLNLLITSTIQNLNLFFDKYRKELLHTKFLDNYNIVINKISEYEAVKEDFNSRKKLRFFKDIGKDYNDFLDNIELLDMLKQDNTSQHRKQLYLYPLVSGIFGAVLGALLGYFIAVKKDNNEPSIIEEFTQHFQSVKGVTINEEVNNTDKN